MKKPHIMKKINNIRIREKLLISYMLVVFLPVLLVGFILNFSMRSIIINNAMREASVNVDRVNSRLGEVMKLLMDISYKTQMDQNLETLLLTQYNSTQEVFDSYYQYGEFKNVINIYSREIKEIKIYSSNNSILNSGQFIKITPDITNSTWYKRINNADGRICWQYLSNKDATSSNMCLTRIVRTISSYKVLGALVIGINGDYLNSLVASEPYDIFFVDDQGVIFVARDKGMLGKNILNSSISMMNGAVDGTMQTSYTGKPAKAIVKSFFPSKYNGAFKIISIVPVSVIQKQTESSAILVAAIMASSLLLAIILIFIFTGAISRRIKKLSHDMHVVAMGKFDLIAAIDGEDEIGQLSSDLIVMTNSLKELVQEVYVTKAQTDQLAIKQKEIKLKMLANQINPHFLFNTLETIRMRAHCKGETELANTVKLLGKIMRKNLEVGNEMITLESEIDMVQCYLEIQKYRYGDRINYDIAYENEDIKEYKILPLIIQPLIENAIVHGLEYKEGKGHVSIRLFRTNSYLLIVIEDDGEGMTTEKLQEITESLNEIEDKAEKRIGLKNVHQRLKLYYGDDYGLQIFSEKKRGTRIEISMPEKG